MYGHPSLESTIMCIRTLLYTIGIRNRDKIFSVMFDEGSKAPILIISFLIAQNISNN